MRNRTFKWLVIVVLTQISSMAYAQFSVSTNLSLVKPEGKIFFWGGELSGHFSLSDNFRVGVSAGYHKNIPTWMADKETGVEQKVWSTAKPITLSGEYFFFQDKVSPYVGLHAGVLALGNRYENYRMHRYYTYVSPVLGVEYKLTRKLSVSLKLKYGVGLSKHNDPARLQTFTAGIGVVHHFQ
ncbi:MAG: outer membrane beta-barrel protein [Crocinitomicaceae bacterium]